MAFYLMLSTDWAQERLRSVGEDALEQLLGTHATIESVGLSPFTRIRLEGVSLADDHGNPAARVDALEGRFEMADLLRSGKIIIDYVYIQGLRVSIYRDSVGAPLNIDGILKRFAKKEDKEPGRFSLGINNVELAGCAVSYEVLAAPATPGRFNPGHIRLSDISANVYAPIVSTDEYQVRLVDLHAHAACGLTLDNVTATLSMSPGHMSLSGISVSLPHSYVAIDDVSLPLQNVAELGGLGTKIPLEIGISEGTTVYLPDLAAFVPRLADIDNTLMLQMKASGRIDSIVLKRLSVIDAHESNRINVSGLFTGLPHLDSLKIADGNVLALLRNGAAARWMARAGMNVSPALERILSAATNPVAAAEYDGGIDGGQYRLKLSTDCGTISLHGCMTRSGSGMTANADVEIEDVDLGLLLGQPDLGIASASVNVDGSFDSRNVYESLRGTAQANVEAFEYKDYRYGGITATAQRQAEYSALDMRSVDPNCRFRLNANYNHPADGTKTADWLCNIERLNPDTLRLYRKFPGHVLSAMLRGNLRGTSLANMAGEAQISNLKYLDANLDGLSVRRFMVNIDNEESPGRIDVVSDFLQGEVEGDFDLGTIGKSVSTIMSEVFPSYAQFYNVSRYDEEGRSKHFGNDFRFEFTMEDADNVMEFFGLPVRVMDPVEISGQVSDSLRLATVTIDAPWLLQGNNLVENTLFTTVLDGFKAHGSVSATTHYPTKKGPMDVVANITAVDDRLDANIDWAIVREQPINGQVNFITSIRKNEQGKLTVETDFNPGQINFGNEVWNIHNSHIVYSDKYLSVDGFTLQAADQMVQINGVATDMPQPALLVDLNNVKLIDIFETLDINKALISGLATGRVEVSQLFSGTPDIHSDQFHVKDMGYNYTTIGDGDIKIKFDNTRGAFCFDAVLDQPQGRKSYIDGSITPATEGLDFTFRADHVKVGFLKPFMSAFCSDITGYASGVARLYGTFKYLDLDGEIFADSVGLKLDFTGVTYYATDSVHLRPGRIDLRDIALSDRYGNTAKLNGYVTHEFFNSPQFLFEVKDARNLLCYNITQRDNPRWYGTVFGDGGARVHGVPGHVDIDVNMSTSTSPKSRSVFTFELLDTEVAEEYSFIAFRDATPLVAGMEFVNVSTEPKTVSKVKSMQKAEEKERPTTYDMSINMGINPQAELMIVMDPIARDMIRAWGEGHMALTYSTRDDNLDLKGKYTVEKGNYTFSLQDLIYRDFTIRNGSTIEFSGNPYEGVLNLDAAYEVKSANLTDLDESFAQDKDINNTNVRVNALVHVSGTMTQPQLKFDLEFPSLNSDVYRKVRSIISTDELMDQQIIYLLALDRFYTPDYMASTTKGSELFSVASSTISNQLSNILGKLSDNWSIAPNLRSDRGDFSDIEVDVALSSRLLNNRLLFNGNFGYRDKSLNTNQFIGDFDIEYLLNRSGNLRLKAYNRYNDQNYYLRSAQTTQGVGIILSRDFDDFLSVFRRKKKKEGK